MTGIYGGATALDLGSPCFVHSGIAFFLEAIEQARCELRAIVLRELKCLGKQFVVVVHSTNCNARNRRSRASHAGEPTTKFAASSAGIGCA